MRSFFAILGALVLLSAVAAAATWAMTPADVAPPGEAAQSAAPSGSAETARVGAGTQVLRATESGVEAEVIDEPATGGDEPVATEPAPENLGFWAGDVNPTWSRTFAGVDVSADPAEDAVATARRTVYVAGAFSAGGLDLSLIKYVDGTEVWHRSYDGPAHGSDGAFAVAARGRAIYTAGQRETKSGDADLLLIRWNSSGDRVWTRAYDSGARDYDSARDVAVDGDGNVTVVGTSHSTAGGADWVVISYKADGTRRWVARYDGPAHDSDEVRRMVLDSAGNVYVAGYSNSATNGHDALVIRYSKTGTRRWARRYNGTADALDEASSLRVRPGGGVYVAGTTDSTLTGYDGLLLAYSAAGTRLFAVAASGGWSTDITEAQAFYDLEVLPDGDILCGGYDARYADGYGIDRYRVQYHSAGAGWAWSWDYSPGAGNELITDLARDSQGGIYITGTYAASPTTSQIYTQRVCTSGTNWRSKWPVAPTAKDEPRAIAVNGVNAYVVGVHYMSASDYDQVVLGYVY
jgi:hypothetical protein